MKKLAALLASLALALLTAGCGSSGSSADYPADFKVVAGDGAAIVSWTAEPDVDYWLFWGPGSDITTTNWVVSGGTAIPSAKSPRVIAGLTNGRTYSFPINGRKDGAPGGEDAPTQAVVPQFAGANWRVGEPMGTGRLSGVAGGLAASTRIEHLSLISTDAKHDLKSANFEISVDKGKKTIVIDPNKILKDVKSTYSLEDRSLWINLDMGFQKPLEKSNFILQTWYEMRRPVYAEIFDAWEIRDPLAISMPSIQKFDRVKVAILQKPHYRKIAKQTSPVTTHQRLQYARVAPLFGKTKIR